MSILAAAHAQERPFVPDWVRDAVFYQVFPERFANGDPSNDPPGTEAWGNPPHPRNYFGGDLKGIIDHLDHLTLLGVNTLYLNPIFASTSNHKYNTRDYLLIDPHFGDEAMFRRLIDSCHARGIRIILDGVFNHTGVDFFAFDDLRKRGKESPYVGWYNIHSFPVGPVTKPNYECWWNYGSLPKLMTGNPEVRRYLFDVTRHWLERGIDGWRLDVPNEIPHDFWIAWRQLVKSVNPDAYIVGEIWEDASPWLKGDQFDAVMNYRFRSACVDFFAERKSSVSHFDSALARQRRAYPPDVNFVLQNLLGSHDTERFLTLCKGDTASLGLAVLFQMTYVGAPMIYYGDEVGMEGGKDPGCRGTMVWEKGKQNRKLFDLVRRAVAMRRNHAVLRRGNFDTLLVDNRKSIYAFARRDRDSVAVVVLNNSQHEQTVSLPLTPGVRSWHQAWPEEAPRLGLNPPALKISLKKQSGAVYMGAIQR